MEFSYATTTSTADWQEWISRNTAVRDGGLELATTTAIDRSVIADDVIDVGIDSSGIVYTLRSSGSLFRHDPTSELANRLWCHADSTVETPCALCIDGDRVFVADRADGSVTVVSVRLKRTIATIETDATDPIQIASANESLFVLDGTGHLYTAEQDADGAVACDVSLVDPVDFTIDANGRGYVLDRDDGDRVVRSVGGDDSHRERFPITNAAFVAADGSFVPTALSRTDDTLLVAGRLEDGSRALFEWTAESESFHERHRLESPCRTLVARSLSSDDRLVYAATDPNGHCRLLRERRQYARHPRRDRSLGTAFYRYDAGTDDTQWHRLALDHSRTAASTQVRVRYAATNDPLPVDGGLGDLEAVPPDAVDLLEDLQLASIWDLASSDSARLAAERPEWSQSDVQDWQDAAIDTLTRHADTDWTTVDLIAPEDVLLRDADGRYLFVALELEGSPQSSPRVDSVTAFCPRQSYLRYLPDVYQETERSAAFLARYLSVFESVFVDIETEIDRIGRYFDPHAVPSDALSWLEQWLALEPADGWPEDARRELLARAPELYKRRGTKAGLRSILELYFRHAASSDSDDPPSSTTADGANEAIDETQAQVDHELFFLLDDDLDCIRSESVRRQYPLPAESQSFVVFCDPLETDDERTTVESIVTSWKPAHVDATVAELDAEFRLGGDTFLGINSRATTREFSLGATTLGEDTVIVDRSDS